MEILAAAHWVGRAVVTLDKDFAELAVLHRVAHAGIVRLVDFPARQQGLAYLHVLELHSEEIAQGVIITAEPGRLRIRSPESGA